MEPQSIRKRAENGQVLMSTRKTFHKQTCPVKNFRLKRTGSIVRERWKRVNNRGVMCCRAEGVGCCCTFKTPPAGEGGREWRPCPGNREWHKHINRQKCRLLVFSIHLETKEWQEREKN